MTEEECHGNLPEDFTGHETGCDLTESGRNTEGNEHDFAGREAIEGVVMSRPKCYLIVHSVAKKHNVGNLLRSATAFGVTQVGQVRNFYNTLSCLRTG